MHDVPVAADFPGGRKRRVSLARELAGRQGRVMLERGPHISSIAGALDDALAIDRMFASQLCGRRHIARAIPQRTPGYTQARSYKPRVLSPLAFDLKLGAVEKVDAITRTPERSQSREPPVGALPLSDGCPERLRAFMLGAGFHEACNRSTLIRAACTSIHLHSTFRTRKSSFSMPSREASKSTSSIAK